MMRKIRVLAAASAVALVSLGGVTASTAATAGTEVVTESDVERQAENTPPANNWVLYTRAGTPATAGEFVDGPATPPLGSGSLQLTTATGAEKVQLFNFDHVGTEARRRRRHLVLDLPQRRHRPSRWRR